MKRSIIFGERDFQTVQRHLWRDDGEEHAVILGVGVCRTETQLRLLVRRVLPVRDEDFIPTGTGYHLRSRAIADACLQLAQEGLGYVSVHNHPGAGDQVRLSEPDRQSNRLAYPTILDLLNGQPVTSLVFGKHSAAGEVWEPEQRPRPLSSIRVIGRRIEDWFPSPASSPYRGTADERYARQVLMFGDAGQEMLAHTSVGVVGVGGGGSVLVQQLAHLGVGTIIGIDEDVVKRLNLSRIVGSRPLDAEKGTKKVAAMRRMVRAIDPKIRFVGIDGDVTRLDIAKRLRDCDFLFVATDNLRSRNVVNQLAYQYLIPAIQIGVKVESDPGTGEVLQIHGMVRTMLPDLGCLKCHGAISPAVLAREQLSPAERKAQDYTNEPDLEDPSVVTFNSVVASMAMTDFQMLRTGLYADVLGDSFPGVPQVLNLQHRRWLPLTREWHEVEHQQNPRCRTCGRLDGSAYAAGDRWDLLPCRAVS